MKILGIVCSPRKGGNTEIMVGEALVAARETASARGAEADTELVLVADKHIAPCDGCGSCRKTGSCWIRDDMPPLYEQMEAADGIIFGTPVYFGDVSAQAKSIMDRTYVFRFGRRLTGKVAGPIVVTRRVGAASTRNILYSFFIAQGMIAVRAGIGYGQAKGDVRQGVGGADGATALGEAVDVGKDVVNMVLQLSKP